jgi:hypothetical protein
MYQITTSNKFNNNGVTIPEQPQLHPLGLDQNLLKLALQHPKAQPERPLSPKYLRVYLDPDQLSR